MANKLLTGGLMLLAVGSQEVGAATAGIRINATQPGVSGPVCVRAIIKQSDGSYITGEWGNPSWPPITMRGKAMGPSTVVQALTGVTQITIGKGPDYVPQTITTDLAVAGQTYTLNVALQPALDLYNKGWRAGDAHAHFIHGEGEVSRTPQDAFTMSAAGGFNFISFCEEHLGSGTLTRQQMLDQWKPYENSECKLWMGVEEPKNEWGHHVAILYDPWSIRSPVPYHWGIHSIHEQGGVSIPVHTDRLYPGRYYDDSSTGHRQWFFFPANNHLKSYPLDALIGHLYDGWSGVSDQGYSAIKLPPYFKLLEMGYRIPYMADSDFCFDRVNNGEKGLGCWMTFYHLEGQPLTRAALINAVRKGRVMSTTGPLVLFTIDGAMSGDTLPADGASRTVRIEASHTFNPWKLDNLNIPGSAPCQVKEIDLYRNGQLIKSWTPNTPTAVVTYPINETATNAYYMVRVLGNDSQWMAGYASPIYFDNTVRPRQPAVFKSLVQGRLYDSVSGLSLTGAVSCVRYGETEWTIPTDSQGRFQAKVPIDAQLVAKDSLNRQFTQDIMQYEPAYSFCTYLSDNYLNNMVGSIEPFKSLVQTLRWEFPMGYQPSASYVRTNLSGEGVMSNFSIASAPGPTSSKDHTEIAMLLLDKTQAQIGDTIHYAILFRQPQGQTPTESLSAEWRGWDPSHPRMYNRYGTVFQYNDGASFLVNVGGGFFLRQGSVVVPPWIGNPTDTTAGMKLYVTVRKGSILEEAALLVPVGATKRQLLVSSTWDGLPAGWGERGIGPCDFYREWTSFEVRYADYRNLAVNLSLNGQPIAIRPAADTAHCADADNAIFYEHFYYDAQCEPQYRNIPFRDPVRSQPAAPDFSSVPIQNAPDTTAPMVAAIEPRNGDQVPAGTVRFYYSIDDSGLSGAATAVLWLDGNPAATNTTGGPIILNLNAGPHTWQVRGFDKAGNQGLSALISLTATNGGSPPPDTTPPTVSIAAPANNSTISGAAVLISATASDNVSVTGVQVKLDGGNLGAELVSAPYTVTWNAASVASGLHRLTAVARDPAGNRATSAVVSVVVTNTIVLPGATNELVWVDDALPAGAIPGADGGDAWTWVNSNPAPFSGAVASQSSVAAGAHQHFFNYATTTLTVNTGDVLFAYVYLDPSNLPSEVMLQWTNGSWEHRAYWGMNKILSGTNGTPSRFFAGPLPLPGQWTRLEVAASQVGLEGTVLKGMAFSLFDGRATWDAAGKSTARLTVPPPTTNNDLVWFDDTLPLNGVPGADGGDSWNWVTSNPTPFSGVAAHQSNSNPTNHQHFFNYASATLPVNTGDVLFAYVYLDPANPPIEAMLQWNNGTWEHRAYWGANMNTFGVDGTASRRSMGPLPGLGRWVRLEIPARSVGLEGSTLKGMAFSLVGGRATWDRVGKRRSSPALIKSLSGAITISWPSEAGQLYRVVCKSSLSATNWTEISGSISATDSMTTWTDTTVGADSQRFYQIVQ